MLFKQQGSSFEGLVNVNISPIFCFHFMLNVIWLKVAYLKKILILPLVNDNNIIE